MSIPLQRAIFGKSGTDKSTLMRNKMVQNIHNDVGLTGLDPHVDLISDVFDNIPKYLTSDVTYLNAIDPEPISLARQSHRLPTEW